MKALTGEKKKKVGDLRNRNKTNGVSKEEKGRRWIWRMQPNGFCRLRQLFGFYSKGIRSTFKQGWNVVSYISGW